jgi:hypothetical protein
MKELKTGEFPLRSSLFWPNNGKTDSTWRYLSDKLPETERQAMIAWMTAQGMNTMIYLTYARGGDCEINPFVQTYGPDVNWAKAARWMSMLEPGKHGANLIPCLFCDDDPETAQNIDFTNFYTPAACQVIGPYSRAVCAGLEMTEQYNTFKRSLSVSAKAELKARFRDSMTRIIKICHDNTDRPILIHAQWDMVSPLPAGLDGLIYEHPWHPGEGENHSADEVASIGARVIATAGIPVGFNEYNLTPWTQRGREQSRALAKLPCFLVGGPV